MLFFANLFGHFSAKKSEKSIFPNIPERKPYLEKWTPKPLKTPKYFSINSKQRLVKFWPWPCFAQYFCAFALKLDRRLKSGYYSGGEGGSSCKGKFWHINPWHVFDFSSDIFLAQLSLGKSQIHVYCERNFHNLGYAYWVYSSLLKFNWKK